MKTRADRIGFARGLAKIAGFAALAGVLAWRLDLAEVLALLAGVRVLPLLGILALVQGQVLVSALRWRLIARRLGLDLGYGEAVREYYLALLLNSTLPGGMAGDAVRAYRARAFSSESATRRALRSVVLERASGQVAFFAVTGLGLLAWPGLIGRALPEGLGLAFGLSVAAGGGVMGLLAFLAFRGPAVVRRALAGLGDDTVRAVLADGGWLVHGALALLLVASYILAFWLASSAVGAPPPPVAFVTVLPVTLLAMLLPLSPGGWGVREAAAAALWPLMGFSPETGVAASVLYGLAVLAGAVPGIRVWWRG